MDSNIDLNFPPPNYENEYLFDLNEISTQEETCGNGGNEHFSSDINYYPIDFDPGLISFSIF